MKHPDWMHRWAAPLGYIVPPLLAFAGLLLFWEIYIDWRDVSIIVVPPPSEVIERFVEDPGFFWEQAWYTLYEATLGLLVGSALAILLAVLMSHSQVAERTVMPLALSLKMTPLVAIGPVLVIALGFGTEPKVAMAALLCFFPTLVNAITGFRDVNPGALEFMRSLHASSWQVFWKLRLPSALPYLFAALKVTYPLALTGAVVAEWFVGNRGLGLVIFRANNNLDTPTLFAAVAVLAITGVAIYGAISALERRVLFWHESVRSTQ
jgi:NitT/TauT family transport system permease protein